MTEYEVVGVALPDGGLLDGGLSAGGRVDGGLGDGGLVDAGFGAGGLGDPGALGADGPDGPSLPSGRRASRARATRETTIDITLDLDGSGRIAVDTGVPFFDHMVSQLGKHGGWDLRVAATGDLATDTHHTVEDVGILLGETFRVALGDKAGVRRFASIAVPLDEALIDVAVDLSGRPFLVYEVDPSPGGEAFLLGTPGFDPQLAEEFWRAFVSSAGLTLHLRMRSGRNTHHILEASFKGVARALRDAVRIDGGGVPSTKGTL